MPLEDERRQGLCRPDKKRDQKGEQCKDVEQTLQDDGGEDRRRGRSKVRRVGEDAKKVADAKGQDIVRGVAGEQDPTADGQAGRAAARKSAMTALHCRWAKCRLRRSLKCMLRRMRHRKKAETAIPGSTFHQARWFFAAGCGSLKASAFAGRGLHWRACFELFALLLIIRKAESEAAPRRHCPA